MTSWSNPLKKLQVELHCDHSGCRYSTRNEISLNRHSLLHLYKNRFKCEDCHHSFGDEIVYYLHRKTHEAQTNPINSQNDKNMEIEIEKKEVEKRIHGKSSSISPPQSKSIIKSTRRSRSRSLSRSRSKSTLRLNPRRSFRSRSKSKPTLKLKPRSRSRSKSRSRSRSNFKLTRRLSSRSKSRSRSRSKSTFRHDEKSERKRHSSQPQPRFHSYSRSRSHSRPRKNYRETEQNYERGYFTCGENEDDKDKTKEMNDENEERNQMLYQRGYFTSEYLAIVKSQQQSQSQSQSQSNENYNTIMTLSNDHNYTNQNYSSFSNGDEIEPAENPEAGHENTNTNQMTTPPASPEPEPEPKSPEIIPIERSSTETETESDDSYRPSSSRGKKLHNSNRNNRKPHYGSHKPSRSSSSSSSRRHYRPRHKSSDRRNSHRGRIWSVFVRGKSKGNQNRWVVKNKAMVKSYSDSPPLSKSKSKSNYNNNNNNKRNDSDLFKCKLCSYVCRQRGRFMDHQVSHSSARNFLCKYCENSFKYSKNLKRHIQTAHFK